LPLHLSAHVVTGSLVLARAYREAIRCEVLRAEVFAGKKKPFLMGEPAQWLACLIDALAHEGTAARDLRARALDEAPATAGHMGEHRFEWLADSDTRLGPVCELLTHGSYYWLPFDAIAQIGLEPVQDLRDLVWLPCEVTLRQGTALQGFMPVRYPLVPADDDATRLSRRTQWSPLDSGSSDPADASGHVAGHGQRTWVTDTEDFPMLQARKLTLETVG
jgi:type VI secretion system protein ImpE